MGKYQPGKYPQLKPSIPRCLPDTPKQVAQTMREGGYMDRLQRAFYDRIAFLKGKR
jgi:hypothetical protein